ncbi:MerR family transcriptional regulator [Nitratireductor sp. ZSWI3]|uniref:MerR family transcriptional regulator n=1 Tax=Nitratireductor sp. ZSWI3 TaxID=2966359 RepID=UPI00214FE95A|nr:MerR family transcriptional regulator [Nitratireductor sp. ZSWI3]MCR4268558.1 MerR family transcriptional regulator [Nitratireductor sp. ZSWI3]
MSKVVVPIGDVAERFGMEPSELGFYEEIELPKPALRRSGLRYYGMMGLRRLAPFHLLRSAGLMRLDDIATTIDPKADRPGWHKTLGRQVVALEIQIENAQRAVSVSQTHGEPVQKFPPGAIQRRGAPQPKQVRGTPANSKKIVGSRPTRRDDRGVF